MVLVTGTVLSEENINSSLGLKGRHAVHRMEIHSLDNIKNKELKVLLENNDLPYSTF